MIRVTIVLVPLLACAAVARGADGDPLAARFLAELRARRLDQLFDAYCSKRWKEASLDEPIRTQIALDYAAHLAVRAGEAADEQTRSRHWDSAKFVLVEAAKQATGSDSRLLLQLQAASLDLARGQWHRAYAELDTDADEHIQAARGVLAEAIAAFQQLAGTIDELTKDRRSEIPRPALAELASIIQRRLAAAELELALCHSAGSAERRKPLDEAAGRLERLVRPAEQRSLDFQPALELAKVYRYLGRFSDAERLFDRLKGPGRSQAQLDELLAERVEALLDQDKTVEALALLYPALRDRSPAPPRWELLHLRVLLQQARSLGPEDAGKLQSSAFTQLQRIEKEHGGVWARRAEILLSRHALDLVGPAATERRRAAATLMRSGKFTEAAKVFDQAADAALEQKRSDEAFSLRVEAGRAWQKTGQLFEAATTFERAVRQQPDHPRGPDTLLEAIHALREAFRARPNNRSATRLEELLTWHLRSYPSDPNAGAARFYLGELRRAQQRFPEAVRAFASVDDERWRPVAQLETARTYEDWLNPLSGTAEDDRANFSQALDHLHQLEQPQWLGRFTTEQQAEIGCRLARFLLDSRSDQPEEAIERLNAVLRLPSLPATWRHVAQRYLLYALVLDARYREAEMLATEQAQAPVSEILNALQLVNAAGLVLTDLERKLMTPTVLPLLQALQRGAAGLPADRQYEADLARALAAVEIGRTAFSGGTAEAEPILARLRAQNPKDARVLEAQALALMQQDRFTEAAERWRALIGGVRAGSALWYRAKLQLVICLRRAGQPEQARKIIDVLQVLHPEMGGSSLKARILDERARLKRL